MSRVGFRADEFGVMVGDITGPTFRVSWQWKDSTEVSCSTGSCAIGYRLYPDQMRAVADWLRDAADRIEGGAL